MFPVISYRRWFKLECRTHTKMANVIFSSSSWYVDRTVRKPDFVGLYPQNVTIMEGSTARLQCRVISDTPLFLQWLKRLDRLSPYEAHRQAVAGVDNGRPDSDGVLQVPNYGRLSPLTMTKSIHFYYLKKKKAYIHTSMWRINIHTCAAYDCI